MVYSQSDISRNIKQEIIRPKGTKHACKCGKKACATLLCMSCWKKYRQAHHGFVVSIDFDGTIIQDGWWPSFGPLVKDADKYIKALRMDGHTIIINTLRKNSIAEDTMAFLHQVDIPFDYFNENVCYDIEIFGDSRKIAADYYIDDRNIGGIPPWKSMYKTILEDQIKVKQFIKNLSI